MDKTKEQDFFALFKRWGILDELMSLWCYIHNVPFLADCYSYPDGRYYSNGKTFASNYKNVTKIVHEIIYHSDLLKDRYREDVLDEINNNLNECHTQNEKLVYIVSIIKKMTEFNFHEILFYGCHIESTEKRIKELYESYNYYKELGKRIRDEKDPRFKIQGEKKKVENRLTFYNTSISEEEEELESLKYKGTLVEKKRGLDSGTIVDGYICFFIFRYIRFVYELDALLLAKGFDIMEIQRESECYIMEDRDDYKLSDILGSKEIANKLINDLHKEEKEREEEAKERGREEAAQKEGFKKRLLGTEEEKKKTLGILHKLIDGKKGKEVAMIIRAAIDSGKITRPTFTEAKKEFGEIGNKSGYNKYLMDDYKYTEKELIGIKEHFKYPQA